MRGASSFCFLLHFKIIPKWEEKTLPQVSCLYFHGIDSSNSISVKKYKQRVFTENNTLRRILNAYGTITADHPVTSEQNGTSDLCIKMVNE